MQTSYPPTPRPLPLSSHTRPPSLPHPRPVRLPSGPHVCLADSTQHPFPIEAPAPMDQVGLVYVLSDPHISSGKHLTQLQLSSRSYEHPRGVHTER